MLLYFKRSHITGTSSIIPLLIIINWELYLAYPWFVVACSERSGKVTVAVTAAIGTNIGRAVGEAQVDATAVWPRNSSGDSLRWSRQETDV